jgi:ATP-dependent DNA helicase RecQ
LLQRLREEAPDAEQGGWQDLNLPRLTTALKEAVGQDLLPLNVSRLLHSLAQDHDPDSQRRSSFELRQINRDYLKLRITGGHTWRQIEKFGEKRRNLAGKLLEFLIGKLPAGVCGSDLLVETSFGELAKVIESDLDLLHQIPPLQHGKAVNHVLLYLHRQDILTLNHGMTVMRRAMTIKLNPEKRDAFLKKDYQRLDEHYREKRIQVHVMREYAEMALKEMAKALQLVLDYFTQSRQNFIKRYFSGREEVLKLSTSEASWKSIIGTLNPVQKEIVADDKDINRLVLAGPGSGKTRVIVHRIAYLLRVQRVSAASIVALTFNRHAANEIRKRLLTLVGADAYGVSVMTYHGMAMRLTGTRFERKDVVDERALTKVMSDAVELLEGKREVDGEDDLREQLLRGYRYILVDEYQDIDELQYRLVSALAGRHVNGEDRLCIMAVGDDDQNIYAWRDTSNRYIERFREDHDASIRFLVDNYRSSRYIIDAANQLIGQNPARLKKEHPVQIDRARRKSAPGGSWEILDQRRNGRVLRLMIGLEDRTHGNLQAQAAMMELERLLALEQQESWNACAILARTHRYLWPVQAWCERNDIPYFLAADKETALPITRQRSFVAVIDHLRALGEPLCAEEVWQYLSTTSLLAESEWRRFFQTASEQLQSELGSCQLGSHALVDWFHDYACELRQQARGTSPRDGAFGQGTGVPACCPAGWRLEHPGGQSVR